MIRTPFPHATFLILIACLLTVAMYVHAYDTIRSEAEQTLKRHTVALDEANRKLLDEIVERRMAQQKVQERTEELSELNRELNETVEQLARLNADKNELMNMIAHDLRNPLTGALLAARQLERHERIESADNRKHVADVTRSIQYTMKLINNFLGLKAIESGKTELELEVLDLATVADEVVEGFRARAADKGIELWSHVEPVYARADRAAIAEVLENLVSNALKFSYPGTRVEVSAGARDGRALLTVRDHGPGISDDDQRRMFKMFGRLSARPTGGEESIGLGLSIARKLAELMAGSVRCESTLGKGAAFTVELPLVMSGHVAKGRTA